MRFIFILTIKQDLPLLTQESNSWTTVSDTGFKSIMKDRWWVWSMPVSEPANKERQCVIQMVPWAGACASLWDSNCWTLRICAVSNRHQLVPGCCSWSWPRPGSLSLRQKRSSDVPSLQLLQKPSPVPAFSGRYRWHSVPLRWAWRKRPRMLLFACLLLSLLSKNAVLIAVRCERLILSSSLPQPWWPRQIKDW